MMLADRDTQLDVEEEVTGKPALWQEVYAIFRCLGSLCDRGPHCWIDPVGKKHYHLRTQHLKTIIDKIRAGRIRKSHDDVPNEVR